MLDFLHIDYLQLGNERQRKAFLLLKERQVFELLASFSPLLAGTIPLEIDIETSDLDILCHCPDQEAFVRTLERAFGREQNFRLCQRTILGHASVIARCTMHGFELEFFGQNVPSAEQIAFRHMLIEHQILMQKGPTFRQQIVDLKQQGYKTEPAFAIALGLTGDPYTAILHYPSLNAIIE